jgi:Gas vesicle synthesis protein GvpL/GvpF
VNEAPTSRAKETGTALYVYGIVPASSSNDLFAGVEGIDSDGPVTLIGEGDLAAIASEVPLREFGEAVIEQNLRDPAWLEEKVRAHDRVLEAVVGRATVLPFRFGTIYRGEDQVRRLLADRPDFAQTLTRLDGTVELGVKAFLDHDAIRARLLAERGLDEDSPSSGRAYMQRRQLDRRLDEEIRDLAADWAHESHLSLVAAALDGRMNALPQPELTGEERQVVLNGAYLVRGDQTDRFHRALAALEDSYAEQIVYQLTGPWPPYNFAQDGEE